MNNNARKTLFCSRVLQLAPKHKKNWSALTTLSNSGTNARPALSDQGSAIVAWQDPTTGDLHAARNLDLFPLEPPRHVVGKTGSVSDHFLLQSTKQRQGLVIQWKKSLAPDVVQYDLRLDGMLIETIPGDKTTTTVSHPSISGHYTLTAVGSNGNRSKAVPVKVTKRKNR